MKSRRAALLPLLLPLLSCIGDAPYGGVATDPCAPGNVRAAGGACAVPIRAVTIDGDASEWEGLESVPLATTCLATPCTGLTPVTMQLARTTDGLLAVRVWLGGDAPITDDPAVEYVVEFSATPEYDSAERDALYISADGAHFRKNDWFIDPPAGVAPPWQFAWSSDGFEAAVPVDYLPFPFGARMSVYTARAAGATWELVTDAAPQTRVCWVEEFIPGDELNDFVSDICRRTTP